MKTKLETALSELKGYPLTIFSVCLFVWILSNMDQSLFGYVIPEIQKTFGAKLPEISWILFASFLTSAVLSILIGVAADKYGRRIMLVACLATSALLVGLHALAPTLMIMAVLRAFAFGISGGLSPITNTYVVEASPARYRGILTGLLQCGYPLGWFFASLFAAPMMVHFGWRSIFLVAFAVIPIALVVWYLLPESRRFTQQQSILSAGEKTADKNAKIATLFQRELRKRTLLVGFAFFTYGGAYAGTAFYFPSFYTDVRGYQLDEATAIVGLSYGIGVIGYIGSAVVGEFYLTRRNTSVIWIWLGALSLLGLIWLPTGYASDIFWFGLMATFFYGTNGVLATLLTEAFPTSVRATGAAVAGAAALNLGFAVYPVLVAQLVGVLGWQWTFTVCVVPSLALSGLALLFLENTRSGLDLDQLANEPVS